jgi:hypothetical protein
LVLRCIDMLCTQEQERSPSWTVAARRVAAQARKDRAVRGNVGSNDWRRTRVPHQLRGDGWLLSREIDMLTGKAVARTRRIRKEQRLRLHFARLLRGHATSSRAARLLGLSRGTAGMHENGLSSLSDEVANTYAAAYAIDARWLLSGEGPSGFGPAVDARIRNVPAMSLAKVVPQFEAAPIGRGAEEWAAFRRMFRAALAGRSIGGRIREIEIRGRGRAASSKSSQHWVISQALRTLLKESVEGRRGRRAQVSDRRAEGRRPIVHRSRATRSDQRRRVRLPRYEGRHLAT